MKETSFTEFMLTNHVRIEMFKTLCKYDYKYFHYDEFDIFLNIQKEREIKLIKITYDNNQSMIDVINCGNLKIFR